MSIGQRNDPKACWSKITDLMVWELQKARQLRKLLKYFSKEEIIPHFSVKDTPQIDFASFFDNGKLFLIKIVDLDFLDLDIEKTIDDSTKQLKSIYDKIISGEKTFFYKNNNAGKLPDIDIEPIPILLFNTIKTNLKIHLPENEFLKKNIYWIGTTMDFLSLLDDVESAMHLLKYLRREKFFRNKINIYAFHSLDFYAHYRNNQESFLKSGILPNFLYLGADQWYKYKLEKIRNGPDFQARYVENEPDDFWELREMQDNVFQARNQLRGSAAGVFILSNGRIIWIIAMGGPVDYTASEIGSFELLTELIPYRITQSLVFQTFLIDLEIKNDCGIGFCLLPSQRVIRQNMLNFYDELPRLNSSNPLVVVGKETPEGKIIFYLVYAVNELEQLFQTDMLNAEKFILKQIFYGINQYFQEKMDHASVDSKLDELFQNAQPAFNMKMTQSPYAISNPLSPEYTKPLTSDKSEVQRLIAEFLGESGINSGVYEEEPAKEILIQIYSFLKKPLVDKISQFNFNVLLPYILHNTGEVIQDRHFKKNQARDDIRQIKEFDPIERYSEKNQEISKISSTLRYLLEFTLALMPHGGKTFNEENWLEIQAIGEEFVRTSNLSDHLHFGLAKYQLIIDNDKSFDIIALSYGNLQSHQTNFDNLFIKGAKKSINMKDPQSVKKFYDEIDSPFKEEFSVSFQNFINISFSCLSYLNEKKIQTTVLSESELVQYIILKLNLEEKEILAALELLSLKKENLDLDIVPTWVRNRKHRCISKPIIFTNEDGKKYYLNAWLIDNSVNRWLSEMDQGYLPFNDNFINSPTLKAKLREIRQKANRDHEKEVINLVAVKTKYYENNFELNEKCFTNIPEPSPGEIDVLGIFPDEKKILIIDAKDLKMNYAPRDISQELKRFRDPKTGEGYVSELIGKKNYVTKHLDKILDYYNLGTNEGWKIEALFITSNVSYQASESDYNILTLIDFEEFLRKL